MRSDLLPEPFWTELEPLLSPHPPSPRGGRPRVSDRAFLTALVYVLREVCTYRGLSRRELGYGSGGRTRAGRGPSSASPSAAEPGALAPSRTSFATSFTASRAPMFAAFSSAGNPRFGSRNLFVFDFGARHDEP